MMKQVLSQDEVDSLLRGIAEEAVEVSETVDPGQAAEKGGAPSGVSEIQPYNFLRGEITARGRLPGLEIIFNKFTRRLHTIFGSELGKSVDAGFEDMDVMLYENLIKRFPLPSSIHLVRLEPLRGLGLFVIEARLAYAMVDIFFGGTGHRVAKVEGRDFTPIETNFLGKFVTKMLRGMEEAWLPVIQLNGHYIRSEMNPYLLGASSMGDVMVVANYRIDMSQGVSGTIFFCFPLSSVEELREQLKSSVEAPEDGDGMVGRLHLPLASAEVDIQAVVSVLSMKLKEILQMRPGDMIQLNRQGLEQIELCVEGRPKFLGRGAQRDGNRVFVVSERITNH
ncbi:MAG TPA: FliM/FliN family flagellar motor switch protein [Verrucomicrobiae bacterium]|jgi:flagellar motor switch protein FliM|nr:FliM/FliN family flagellar motor switch protein [Verrucomicrobiae bacterium]